MIEIVNELDIAPRKKGKKIYYNRTNTCDRCGICFKNAMGHPGREHDKNGNWTGKWLCNKCIKKDWYHESCLSDRRIGNLKSTSTQSFGDKFQELVCKIYNWKDLNKINDNYTISIDCYDPNTGLYYQIQGRKPQKYRDAWQFDCRNEHTKEFKEMICFCTSRDRNIIERVYRFPLYDILKNEFILISKKPNKNSRYLWVDKYRVKDEEILKINMIWKEINNI